MKSTTSTPNALLGLLSIQPMSGYDIRQLIPWSIGHFWSESYGQIYPSLKKLAAEGLVTKKTERQKSAPDKYVYSLTDEGREHLRQWLGVPVEPPVQRSELLLKLFFGGLVAPGVTREHLIAFRIRHIEALKIYEATAKRLEADAARDPQLPFWLMTLSFGRHQSRASLRWADECLEKLEKIEVRRKKK